jgi:hypothetical protein
MPDEPFAPLALTFDEISSKREDLIRRQSTIQQRLSALRVGVHKLAPAQVAERDLLAAEFQETARDISMLNQLRRAAHTANSARNEEGYVESSAIGAATDLKDATKLVAGYIGDVHDLLRRWRAEPPESVQDCVDDLARALGSGE